MAKKAGMTLTVGHIYNIRASDKRKASKTNGSPAVAPVAVERSGGSNEDQLRSLVLRMGLDKVDAVIDRVRAQLKNA